VDGTSHTITVNIYGTMTFLRARPLGPPVNTGGGDPNDFDDLVGSGVGVINGTGAGTTVLLPSRGLKAMMSLTGLVATTISTANRVMIRSMAVPGNDGLTGNQDNDTLYGQAAPTTSPEMAVRTHCTAAPAMTRSLATPRRILSSVVPVTTPSPAVAVAT